MNPKDAIKIGTAITQFKIANQKVRIMEQINTALPKHKERHFDKLLIPLYAERTRLRFNANQLIKKAQKRDNNPNPNK